MGNKIGLSGPIIRASDEAVKYLERMPGFLTAKDMEKNVNAFRGMRAKDRDTVLRHLRQRSIVNVFEAKRSATGKVIELFRHVKHGPVETIPGYIYPVVPEPSISELVHRGVIASAMGETTTRLNEMLVGISNKIDRNSANGAYGPIEKLCEGCGQIKKIDLFPKDLTGGRSDTCQSCLCRLYKVANAVAKPEEIEPMALLNPPSTLQTPKQKREYAERLIREAEEAEQNSQARDSINKQLAPLRLEANQSFGALYRTFEAMMEAMDKHEKVMAKLKEFKVE